MNSDEQMKESLYKKLLDNYEEYKKNLMELYPGNKLTSETYCKLIALVQNDNIYLKEPEEQKESINKIIEGHFTKEDDIPKILRLYPDELQYQQMKDLEFHNSPEGTKDLLIDFFIQKYFRLNNTREKILTKANQILNFKDFNEKFQVNKDYKIGKINSEIDFTIKRLIRLLNQDEHRKKDFYYYLKHFKVKKLDSIFLKQEQNLPHYSLRKDDFEIYLREKTYMDKITLHLKSFSPYITYCPIKSGFSIWKNSKIFLDAFFRKNFESIMKGIKLIYSSEKLRCIPNDLKMFKEYFKGKYQFYYHMKKEYDDEKTYYNFTYDIYYPPLIISINSEIRPYLKELCEYFLIPFDLSIDKGKAFSYSIDVFYPKYFNQQSKNFSFNPYELTFNEIVSGEIKVDQKSDVVVETKTTLILRNKYNVGEGFIVNGENKFINETLRHTSFKSEVYIKASHWTKCICVFPAVDLRYQTQMKLLNEVGYIDSHFKYILEIIERVDLSTLNRLIEDYTMNTSTKIRNTIKLISSKKEEDDYSQLRELVSEIIRSDDNEKGIKGKNGMSSILNPHDEYTERVDSDLLKYLMTLRFLKLRDYKFYILNLLNYFRYIQKRITNDLYKIENRNWKKTEDLTSLTETLSQTAPNLSAKPKNLIINQPLSEFSKTNPIIPSLERILESKKNEERFDRSYFEEIDETVEYSDKLIRVKDNKGNYIIYEATLSDLKQLEEEFCKIGTYYIQKKEKLIVDTDKVPNPFIDRTQVILDIFMNEFDFLYAKFEYISEMMTIYDNTTDVFEQKELMQEITYVMANRPIVDLNYNYFTASYLFEVEVLRKKAAFMHILIDYQKKMELNENRLLYDSIDKFYWLLGEAALEIIQHVRMDKNDIDTIKKMIQIKREEMAKAQDASKEKVFVDEIENFMSLFTKLRKEKEIENELRIDLNNDKSQESSFNVGSEGNDDGHLLNFKLHDKDDEAKDGKKAEGNEKEMEIKLSILIKYLKKLFNIAITGGEDNFLDNDIDNLVNCDEGKALESIKNSLTESLQSEGGDKQKQKAYQINNRSYSISNTSLDLLNYQIRSLLNIPNPLLEADYMKRIADNPSIVKASLNKDINFIKFEEGYPHKFFEQEDQSVKANEIEFFESLSEIEHVFKLIKETTGTFRHQFTFENEIARQGLEISLIDYFIEEWENFKDCISGRKTSSEFDQVYFLQNTIVDNYFSFLFSVKTLTATLSTNISRIPPRLIAYLPQAIIDTINVEAMNFTHLSAPKDPSQIESLMLIDLEKSLLGIVLQDYKSGWLELQNNLNEVTLYCNMIELYTTKKTIFALIIKNTYLSTIYEKQKQTFLNTHEDMLNYKDSIGLLPPIDFDSKRENYVDVYPSGRENSNTKHLHPRFAIEEFDPTLAACVNFQNILTIQCNLLPNGLNELKTFAHYEYMNFFLLLIATQHNDLLFFSQNQYSTELELYEHNKIIVKNSLFDAFTVIKSKETNKKESVILHELSKKVDDINAKTAKQFFYVIIEKKLKNRNNTLIRYNTFVETKIKFLKKQPIMKHLYSRQERLLLCNAYAKDITFEAFLDSIKLQACDYARHLRKIIRNIPQEYNIFEINDSSFFDNEKKISETTPHKNFSYFYEQDHAKAFNRFYIPSNIEILHLKNQHDADIIFHYSKYNPSLFSEEVFNKKFYSQVEEKFFQSPTQCKAVDSSRNKFFQEAFSYQSNALLFLQFCSFFINFINLKFIDIGLTQKPIDIMSLLNKIENGEDFWGDKKKTTAKFDDTSRLPLNIVEKIVDTQKNYLNLRINFDRFKNDLEEVMKILQGYLENPPKVVEFMEKCLNHRLFHWYHIFNIAREICLKKEDIASFTYLSTILKNNFLFGRVDYFKQVECKFQCHFTPRSNSSSLRSLFKRHMLFEETSTCLNSLTQFQFYPDDSHYSLLNSHQLIFNDDIKSFFSFIAENKIAEIRNLNFKITSMTKNYLIYLEKSTLNADHIELDAHRIDFLKYYIKLTEFKYKFLIVIKNDLISIKPSKFKHAERFIKQNYAKIDVEWIENSSTSDPNEPDILSKSEEANAKKRSSALLAQQPRPNDDIFDNQRENDLKMKNTSIVEAFLTGANTMIAAFTNELTYILYNKAIDQLSKENNAMKELFTSTRSDLDINKFKNLFSSNFLKVLDNTQISNINRKFPFFENFINRIMNISLDVETHSDSNAILLSKREFQETVNRMIKDFITYESNIVRSNHFAYSSEKFGYYFSIKKLEIWLKAYKGKLKQFDEDLEKISNAKTAITNNTLVYEMDNLYRQLKVLKDNISIMETYIRDYFEDKFKGLIQSFRTEMAQIESKFHEFRNNVVITTNQKITEEYNNCISELKNKSLFLTEQVWDKNSVTDNTDEKEFFESFYRGLATVHNYNKDINMERQRIEGLQDDIAKLHGYYRMKLHNQKVSFEKELDDLRKNLSNNKDLWDKLAIAERNEVILKEELSKTQQSLASAEEFIKRLRIQIRNSHNKNVSLEKQISSITVKDIINNAGKGVNVKAMELYSEIRQSYVYNMKNNVNIITALERIKAKYETDEDIKIILLNFEMLHQKYAQEVDGKRAFSVTLQNIRDDIERMQALHNKKLEEMSRANEQLKEDNLNLQIEIEKVKTGRQSQRVSKSNLGVSLSSLKNSIDKFPDIKPKLP